MTKPTEIIQKQKEINDFIESITPKLMKISAKRNYHLIEIKDVIMDDLGITFTAGGFCMGHFEENFMVKWEDLS